MKNLKLSLRDARRLSILVMALTCTATAWAQGPGGGGGRGAGAGGRGMSAAERQAIHGLFDRAASIDRKVEWIEGGYRALTESEDPEAAKLLRRHVSQMYDRLKSGRMVRGWDPAFRAFARHYATMETTIEDTENGVRVSVVANNEAAVLAARRHALVVSMFVAKGWEEAHVSHPEDLEIVDPDGILADRLERVLRDHESPEPVACEACATGACEDCGADGHGARQNAADEPEA